VRKQVFTEGAGLGMNFDFNEGFHEMLYRCGVFGSLKGLSYVAIVLGLII
jgi:hypothetical protein